MQTLSVITTTYNRAYCLGQLYDSLCRQTSKDFIWLVVDDGSTDNTEEIISRWQGENRVEIEYFRKENGGMHTARNLGYEKVHTELNVIIDSDDWMPDDAVEKIVTFWQANQADDIAGIAGLDSTPRGEIVGSLLPKNIKKCHFYELWQKYKTTGDKKLVYRSELTRLYPYPEFPREKFYPASYKFMLIDQNYQILLLNEVLCIVDYNQDSMTFDKFAQYRSCANGFAHFRNATAKISRNPEYICRQYLHYWAECRFAGEKAPLAKADKKFWALLMWLPGLLFYRYLLKTSRKY